jgi:hypothetical protein
VAEPSFHLPKAEDVGRGEVMLGWVRKHGKSLYPVCLSVDDFVSHVAIFGMTGSGKSTTAGVILSDLVDAEVNVLVLDWANEYRSLIVKKGGLVFTPGRNVSSFTLNPLDPSLSDDVTEHICLVTDIFSDIFRFTPPQSWMFFECLRRLYHDFKFSGEAPTLSMLVKEVDRAPYRSTYDIETKLAILRRIKPLTEGQAGRALDGCSTMDMEEVVENIVSIELGHFKEMEVRKIFVQVLLKLLYDLRTRKRSKELRHVTIVEEARNVIPAQFTNMPPSIGERMVNELRKYGEGLVIISQFPTHISQEILKNAGTRIFHAIRSDDDRRIARGALSLTEEQAAYLHFLKPGEAIVKVPNVDHSFLIYVEKKNELPMLSDGELKNLMMEFHDQFALDVG